MNENDPGANDPIRKFQAELEKKKIRAEQLRPVLRACEDAVARVGDDLCISISIQERSEGIRVGLLTLVKNLTDLIPIALG